MDGHLLLWNSTAPIKLQLRSGPRPGLESGCSETLHGHGVCSAADGLREQHAAEVPGPGVELPTIPSCTPGGADPSSPDPMLTSSPTPSKAQVVLGASHPVLGKAPPLSACSDPATFPDTAWCPALSGGQENRLQGHSWPPFISIIK